MKFFLSLIICFLFNHVSGQQKTNIFLLGEGCYIKGHYSEGMNSGSFWYIKRDSSFINFELIQGDIKLIRKGEWHYLGDSILSFKYHPLKSRLMLNSKIDYHSETRGSLDSVYFYGSIKGPDCKLPGQCALILDNEKNEYARYGISVGYGFTGISTDSNGNFGFAVHKNLYYGSLGIVSSPTYYPLTINTSLNNNYHTLNIIVPLRDSTNDIDISKFNDSPSIYKYKPIKKGEKVVIRNRYLPINFITKDKKPLLSLLYSARAKQPFLIRPIDELIEYLFKK